MTTYSVYCFGVAREITGASSIAVSLSPGATVSALRDALEATYPALTELVSYAIARNEVYATEEAILEPNDTLALLPPVSGG